MHPNFEGGDYYTCSHEFDPQADFCQFLKEAKSHAYDEESFQGVTPHVGETRKADLQGERKKKKSWKNSLFSWLKMDRKNKNMVEPLDVSATNYTKFRRGGGILSGPILHGNAVSNISNSSRSRKPTSGPLPGLFNPSKREEADEIVPYMCLNQQQQLDNHPHSFGPVYLVT